MLQNIFQQICKCRPSKSLRWLELNFYQFSLCPSNVAPSSRLKIMFPFSACTVNFSKGQSWRRQAGENFEFRIQVCNFKFNTDCTINCSKGQSKSKLADGEKMSLKIWTHHEMNRGTDWPFIKSENYCPVFLENFLWWFFNSSTFNGLSGAKNTWQLPVVVNW